MKKLLISLLISISAALGTAFLFLLIFNKHPALLSKIDTFADKPVPQSHLPEEKRFPIKDTPQPDVQKFLSPISESSGRITKKPFGIHIAPETSPIQPERFSGYHTGTDFETFPDEKDREVSIYSICDGTLLVKRFASGYGGILVEKCQLEDQPITVIYGHLSLASINLKSDDAIKGGDKLGILGQGFSHETDRERKHLHLGIHKGFQINLLGYVQNRNDLKDWIDPINVLDNK